MLKRYAYNIVINTCTHVCSHLQKLDVEYTWSVFIILVSCHAVPYVINVAETIFFPSCLDFPETYGQIVVYKFGI